MTVELTSIHEARRYESRDLERDEQKRRKGGSNHHTTRNRAEPLRFCGNNKTLNKRKRDRQRHHDKFKKPEKPVQENKMS